jgi:hypothetical protein
MIEYDQPITERKMTTVTHIRCASEKAPGNFAETDGAGGIADEIEGVERNSSAAPAGPARRCPGISVSPSVDTA